VESSFREVSAFDSRAIKEAAEGAKKLMKWEPRVTLADGPTTAF